MAWSCLWLSKPFRRSSTWPVALSACMPHGSVPNLSALIIVPLSPCVSCILTRITSPSHSQSFDSCPLYIISWMKLVPTIYFTRAMVWVTNGMVVWCSFWANVQLGPIRQSIPLRSLQPSWPPSSGRIYLLISSKVIWRENRETIGAGIQGLAAFRHWPVNRSEWNLNAV